MKEQFNSLDDILDSHGIPNRWDSFVHLIRSLNRNTLNIFNHEISSFGITIEQFMVILQLRGPQESINGLSEELNLDRTTLSRGLECLRKMKLVKEVQNPSDRRMKIHILTEAGKIMIAKVHPTYKLTIERIKEILGEKRYLNFLKEMREINVMLRDEYIVDIIKE